MTRRARSAETVTITHPDKLLFPDDGITKGELAAYYEMIAPIMLPHIHSRPVTMERYPNGINAGSFWQKNVSRGFPEWLQRVKVPKKDGVVHHPIVTDTRSLLWLANQNCITPHVWAARAPDLYHPDICLFDLDPARDDGDAVRSAALWLRDFLAELGLPSFVKTSGSKGFHIAIPLDGSEDSETVSQFAHAVGRALVERHPQQLTQEFSKVDRAGRILVDTGRNAYGATFASVYAVRARPGAPVSAPCTWDELERGEAGPRSFTLRNMRERSVRVGDLWAGMHEQQTSLRDAFTRTFGRPRPSRRDG
jgi:bifunctional non-homologous end joining protein LigD